MVAWVVMRCMRVSADIHTLCATALLALFVMGCGQNSRYEVMRGAVPQETVGGFSMDVAAADLDGDGDVDLVVAQEYRPNVLLVNDGTGRFSDQSTRIPQVDRDSEDIGIADFDGDGNQDIVVVSEDDRINELYLANGDGTFRDAGDLLPVTGTTNAVAVLDLNADGAPDIILGNAGQNTALLNDGAGRFTDATHVWLPQRNDRTQDLEAADVDGDGDLDLIVGNEDHNRLLINAGERFVDETADRLPLRAPAEETREADFGDVDGDGDPDLLLANVRAFVADADPQNRLLINDGTGRFRDETERRLPDDEVNAFDGDFVDLDSDGDLDIVLAQANAGWRAPAPYAVWENDGSGRFTDATAAFLPGDARGPGFDVTAFDADGDGVLELYLANRGEVPDMLLRAVSR